MGGEKVLRLPGGPFGTGCNAYILDILQKPDAPEDVVIMDVQAYYSNIQRNWLMEYIPMDKKVLGEFLRAGHVFAGELFPEEGAGISMGANLSPMLANRVLEIGRASCRERVWQLV